MSCFIHLSQYFPFSENVGSLGYFHYFGNGDAPHNGKHYGEE